MQLRGSTAPGVHSPPTQTALRGPRSVPRQRLVSGGRPRAAQTSRARLAHRTGSHTGQRHTPDRAARPAAAGGRPAHSREPAHSSSTRQGSFCHEFSTQRAEHRSKRSLLLASWPRPVTSVHKPEDRDGSKIPAALLHVGLTLAGVVDTVLRKPAGWASVPPKRPGPPLMNTGTPSLPTPPAQGLPWAATYFCIQIQPHKSYCIVSRNLNLCLRSRQPHSSSSTPSLPQGGVLQGGKEILNESWAAPTQNRKTKRNKYHRTGPSVRPKHWAVILGPSGELGGRPGEAELEPNAK